MTAGHSEFNGEIVPYPIPVDEQDHCVLNWIIKNQMDQLHSPIVHYNVDWYGKSPFKECSIKWRVMDNSLNHISAKVFVGYQNFPIRPSCIVLLVTDGGSVIQLSRFASLLYFDGTELDVDDMNDYVREENYLFGTNWTLPQPDDDDSNEEDRPGASDFD